jgi:hypothetical protein
VLDDPDLRHEYDRLRWPHVRFEPAPRARETWPGYGGTVHEPGSPRIDEEWFRRARWEYESWVRRSPPPPPAPVRRASSLSLVGLLRGPFGRVYLLLAVTILLMPLIYLVITNWVEQTGAWLHQIDPTAAPPACVAPDAIITAPQDGASVPARFDVLGSAAPPGFAEYRLELAAVSASPQPENADLATAQAAIAAPAWALLIPPAHTPVEGGVLATHVDLAGRAPGVYVLRLSVSLADGRLLPPCEREIHYDSR